MYNEKILSQLNELKYLHVIKNSNINVMSKKNNFHDIVKFYAQINTEDVIQKISYKATGCTHFVVFCNHFCNLVEGKSIKQALKIDEQKLEEFCELSENRKHILKIIIDTFALLIKKYRKGIEKGMIVPVEVMQETQEVEVSSKKKIASITKEHKGSAYKKDSKSESKKSNSSNKEKNEESSKSEKIEEIYISDNKKKIVAKKDKKSDKESKKKEKTISKSEKTKEKSSESSTKEKKSTRKLSKKAKLTVVNKEEDSFIENKGSSKTRDIIIVDDNNSNDVEILEPDVIEEQSTPVQNKTVVVERTESYYKREVNINQNSIKQADNIIALKSMVKSSKTQELQDGTVKHTNRESVNNLSMMINKLNNNEDQSTDENAKRLQDLSDNLASIRSKQHIENNVEQIDNKKQKKLKKSEDEPKKKKKGLFGWFKK